MKKSKLAIFLSLTMVFLIAFIANAQEIKNLLANGNFEDGIVDPWTTYGNVKVEVVKDIKKAAIDEKIIEGDYCLHVMVLSKGANFWDAGIQHTKHVFEAGKAYTLSAYLKSAKGNLQINFKPELAQDPWTAYGDRIFVMTEKWKQFTTSTPVIPNKVDPASITFHVAFDVGEFWMDDVKFYEGKPEPQPEPAELENGGFETGNTAPWTLYGNAKMEVVKQLTGAAIPENLIEGKYALHVTVNEKGANFWDIGLQHKGHVFKAGKVYTLAAFLKSKEGPLQINFKPELAVDPWTGYGEKEFTMTDKWAEYFVTTPPMPNDVDPASLTFHIGYTKGEFWMDGVRFYEGKYKEPDFKPTKAVESRNKLSTTWGDIKNR
ncbi:TPA: hypothetical protein ENX78_07090 [Candidatus Poribacteria bacterium]|nr:hypothetical protein [Candidatus Poribacteria bacterium]